MRLRIDIKDLAKLFNKVDTLSLRVDELYLEYEKIKKLIANINNNGEQNNYR